jgi:hypothetical protein
MRPLALLSLLAIVAAEVSAQDLSSAANRRCEQRSSELVAALQTADFDAARRHFSAALKDSLDTTALRERWNALPPRVGALRAVGRLHGGAVGGRSMVFVPLIHERATVTGEIACTADGAIDAFRLREPAALTP